MCREEADQLFTDEDALEMHGLQTGHLLSADCETDISEALEPNPAKLVGSEAELCHAFQVVEEMLVQLGHDGRMTVTGVGPPAGTAVAAVNSQIERFQRAEDMMETGGIKGGGLSARQLADLERLDGWTRFL